MAIVRETLDGGIVRTYSNAGVKIHGGFPEGDYNVVYDPEEAEREYVETDIPVEKEPPDTPEPIKVYSKLKILMAADQAGLADHLMDLIESDRKLKYIWDASNTIEDNELLGQYLPDVAQALGKTVDEVKAFLDSNCVAD